MAGEVPRKQSSWSSQQSCASMDKLLACHPTAGILILWDKEQFCLVWMVYLLAVIKGALFLTPLAIFYSPFFIPQNQGQPDQERVLDDTWNQHVWVWGQEGARHFLTSEPALNKHKQYRTIYQYNLYYIDLDSLMNRFINMSIEMSDKVLIKTHISTGSCISHTSVCTCLLGCACQPES